MENENTILEAIEMNFEKMFIAIKNEAELASYINGSADYLKMIHGIMYLDYLECKGLDESSDADAVRDYLDIPWLALSVEEKVRVQKFSSLLRCFRDLVK